jgi:uncharacterized protein
MSKEMHRAIAAKGGAATPAAARSFSKDPALAREAGIKGGKAVPAQKRSYSVNRRLAQEAGSKGGTMRRINAALAKAAE